jgi:hypothetical protein
MKKVAITILFFPDEWRGIERAAAAAGMPPAIFIERAAREAANVDKEFQDEMLFFVAK